MRMVFRALAEIWPSLVAALLAAVGGFLSMGMLGLVLLHLVSPVLAWRFPPLADWDPSLVWPLTVAMPIVWSPVFVVAGLVDARARRGGWGRSRRVPLYVAIVWLAALAVWWGLLTANPALWR